LHRTRAVKGEQEGADLLERGEPANDQKLRLGAGERLECDITKFSRELDIVFRDQFDPLARITREHRIIGDRFDRRLILTVHTKKKSRAASGRRSGAFRLNARRIAGPAPVMT